MSDEPSNAASEWLRTAYERMNQVDQAPNAVRAAITDEFIHEDRRRGPSFPNVDAETFLGFVETAWETGAGRPQWTVREIVAVRGERFAAGVCYLDYGNGMGFEAIYVFGLDANLRLLHRGIDFDVDDLDEAIAELDRMQSQADAS